MLLCCSLFHQCICCISCFHALASSSLPFSDVLLFFIAKSCSSHSFTSSTSFAPRSLVKLHMHNNESEILVFPSFTCAGNVSFSKGTLQGKRICFVWKYLHCLWDRLVYWGRRRLKNWGFVTFMYIIVAMHFAYFESLILYRNTHGPCYVLKRLITAHLRGFM